MSLSLSIYGGCMNNIIFASSNNINLNESMQGMKLLSGSHIIIFVDDIDTKTYLGKCSGNITGEYMMNDNQKKGRFEANIKGNLKSKTLLTNNDLINIIGRKYTIETDDVYTKYITQNGNYSIANTEEIYLWNVDLTISRTTITPYSSDDIVNDGVYSYVKSAIDKISHEMLNKSISTMINELYETPDYIKQNISASTLFNNQYTNYNNNSIPVTLDETKNKELIKAKLLRDYDTYHYYKFKIPIVSLSRDAILNLYYNYSRSYYIDILEYDGDILGLYVIGKR